MEAARREDEPEAGCMPKPTTSPMRLISVWGDRGRAGSLREPARHLRAGRHRPCRCFRQYRREGERSSAAAVRCEDEQPETVDGEDAGEGADPSDPDAVQRAVITVGGEPVPDADEESRTMLSNRCPSGW